MKKLPTCLFVLLGLFITLSLSTSESTGKGWRSLVVYSKEKGGDCGLNQVWVNSTFKAACFPLANLGEKCDFSLQCRSPNSFCGTSPLSVQICMCTDGHQSTPDNITCFPRHQCSNTNFNSAMEPSTDCGPNQFCRRQVCLCAANYTFNFQGFCVPEVEPELEVNLSVYLEKIKSLNAMLESKHDKMQSMLVIGVLLVILLVMMIFAGVVGIVYYKRRYPFYQEVIQLQEVQANV